MSQPASEPDWRRLGADVGRIVARRLPTSADVEDVVQEVLLRVWRHRAGLRDDERFGGWLARIVQTAVADHLRDRMRHPVPRHVPGEAGDDAPALADSPDQTRALITAVLDPFVQRLPAIYREAVVLSELEELPHATIAARLGLSVTGVKSRVQRGRKLLRKLLDRCCEIALDARGTPTSCEIRPDGDVPPGCCDGLGRPRC